MEAKLIKEGRATLEDLVVLNGLGFTFTVSSGTITEVIGPDGEERY